MHSQQKSTEPVIHVNTLLYFDEETTSESDRLNTYQVLFTKAYFWRGYNPYGKFLEVCHINFRCLNGYNEFWDSPDGVSSKLELLQKAIEQKGESGT